MEAPASASASASSSGYSAALLSSYRRGFLDDCLKSSSDLSTELPSLLSRLDQDCDDLESDLLQLAEQLSLAASRWLSRSDDLRTILRRLPLPPSSLPARIASFLEMELPLLEKEVGRIETLRLYAETSLQFEGLVGDLEDATLTIISQDSHNFFPLSSSSILTPRGMTWKHDKLLSAVKTMTDIEILLISVLNNRLRWTHLLMAVDFRVDKALAALRTQALTDHRSLLASFGWPPSLSSKLEKNDIMEIPNPLVLMQGEKKDIYSQSFLLLCALQHFQHQREARQRNLRHKRNSNSGHDLDMAHVVDNDLWTINELVNPIASKMELHFSRWSDQPKFIFALVYKITRDFTDGVDNVLQPLIDKARLVGVSAKEAWITAMVRVLSKYLETEVLPSYCKSYGDRDGLMEVISSWLHLVDNMTTFDKRMQDLAISGTSKRGPLLLWEGFSRSLSVFSVFNDHSDWLQIWAEMELKDAEDKLNAELENENSWSSCIKQQGVAFEEKAELYLLSTVEDYRAPSIADYVVKNAWQMVEKAGHLPSVEIRVCFIRSSAVIFLKRFFHILLQRCQDAKLELLKSNIEDHILLRLAECINITRYTESVIREWSDDVNFLEMNIVERYAKGMSEGNQHKGTFFGEEIEFLVKLGTDSLVEIMSALLLQFDALCREYIDYIEQWDKEEFEHQDPVVDEPSSCVSPAFVKALDMLQDTMSSLKSNLNSKDFLDLWRSIADGVDYFIFHGILLSDVKFSKSGVYQFKVDINALFQIFRRFCARPEAYFPFISNSLKLLTMKDKDVAYLLNVLPRDNRKKEEFLRLRGLSHVNVGQAEKVLKNKSLEYKS